MLNTHPPVSYYTVACFLVSLQFLQLLHPPLYGWNSARLNDSYAITLHPTPSLSLAGNPYNMNNCTWVCKGSAYKQTVNGREQCLSCPSNSNSPAGSTALTSCACNAGYSGPNGGVCTECEAGKYKASTGPAACTNCPSSPNSL